MGASTFVEANFPPGYICGERPLSIRLPPLFERKAGNAQTPAQCAASCAGKADPRNTRHVDKIEGLVKKYSQFMMFPILLKVLLSLNSERTGR